MAATWILNAYKIAVYTELMLHCNTLPLYKSSELTAWKAGKPSLVCLESAEIFVYKCHKTWQTQISKVLLTLWREFPKLRNGTAYNEHRKSFPAPPNKRDRVNIPLKVYTICNVHAWVVVIFIVTVCVADLRFIFIPPPTPNHQSPSPHARSLLWPCLPIALCSDWNHGRCTLCCYYVRCFVRYVKAWNLNILFFFPRLYY